MFECPITDTTISYNLIMFIRFFVICIFVILHYHVNTNSFRAQSQNYPGRKEFLLSGHFYDHFPVFLEQPHWVQEPIQSQVVAIGSDVHINCLALGKPPPKIMWRKNGELLQGKFSKVQGTQLSGTNCIPNLALLNYLFTSQKKFCWYVCN